MNLISDHQLNYFMLRRLPDVVNEIRSQLKGIMYKWYIFTPMNFTNKMALKGVIWTNFSEIIVHSQLCNTRFIP